MQERNDLVIKKNMPIVVATEKDVLKAIQKSGGV